MCLGSYISWISIYGDWPRIVLAWTHLQLYKVKNYYIGFVHNLAIKEEKKKSHWSSFSYSPLFESTCIYSVSHLGKVKKWMVAIYCWFQIHTLNLLDWSNVQICISMGSGGLHKHFSPSTNWYLIWWFGFHLNVLFLVHLVWLCWECDYWSKLPLMALYLVQLLYAWHPGFENDWTLEVGVRSMQ